MGKFDHYIDCLPQRPPFLFVDEILDHAYMERVQGAVEFPDGHRIFENHLPGEPLVPGVILIEALAQVAGIVMISEEGQPIRGYLGEVSRVRFRKTIKPGDRVLLDARLLGSFGNAARFEVSASVSGSGVVEGEIVLVRQDIR